MVKKNEDEKSLSWKADAAFIQASYKVIQRAKQTGTPVVMWKDGHVIEVPAEEMESRLKDK